MLYVMLFGQYPFETQQPGGPKLEPDRRIRTMMDRIVNMQVGARCVRACAPPHVGRMARAQRLAVFWLGAAARPEVLSSNDRLPTLASMPLISELVAG